VQQQRVAVAAAGARHHARHGRCHFVRIAAIARIAACHGCTQLICPSSAARLPLLGPTLAAAARTRQTCWSSTDKLPPCVFFLWEEPAGEIRAASGSSAARHSIHPPMQPVPCTAASFCVPTC
jgi:hypothetical protein